MNAEVSCQRQIEKEEICYVKRKCDNYVDKHRLGENAGLSNAIQIMSPTANNPLSNYVITGNKLIGHSNEVTNFASSGIVIAQGYKPGSIGQDVLAIIVTPEGYANLLKDNIFENNKINLTHQDWSKPADEVVLYINPEAGI